MTTRPRCIRILTRGTTLVELMIVVVILGILASIATVGYKRYVGRARLSEANAMLAELSAKEQLFFMDAGAYVAARRDDNLAQPSPNEDPAAFIPVNPTLATFESVRTANDVGNPMPTAWSRIGLRPRWAQLYCTYLVNAGGASQNPPVGIGSSVWSVTPAVPWFYAVAACNLNNSDGSSAPAGLPANTTFLVLTHDSPALVTLNDGH